ncbi:MAG TPA: BTAD domain-containing putative transcriptional regulator [Streptosporangiaceae bacterium]|nr:BTAD domain-containing putative transcriptional regulator [Streptosporangiaceae bacterium]
MRIGILGPLEVRDDDGRAVPIGGTRLRVLLIRLALDAGRTVTADRLAADMWPGGGPADPANALQALVSRLRGAAGPGLVEHGPGGYRLAVEPGEVDATAFERLVADGRALAADGDQARGADALRQALSLWRGPALADAGDAPFAAGPAARLEELRLAATEDRIEADLALGHGAELVPEAEELAAAHPLRERLRGQLMRALYAAGRQADALAVYEDTRKILAGQLGVDPSPALSAVHLAILRGELEPAIPAAGHTTGDAERLPPPAARTGPGRTTNLPAQLTSFVGREDELALLGRLLDESRLVTLTGPGGAGKTRLAIEASAALVAERPDGVWFVPLAPVRDALDVPQAVLTAIGVHEAIWATDQAAVQAAVMQPLDRLADVLASRKPVLVLDNCEHLLDAVAALAGRLLADAPGVRILATSREPLGITGEMLCPVPSLPLPPENAGAGEAAGYAAVRLFADRAAAVRPGFAVDAASVGPVVRICRALDGIPLAIELAAARLRALTPGQVADRLGDRFRLLSAGSRTALPRHQTLRATVDWSWDLLNEAERTVLRRLSVFSGGAVPDGAEYVCAPGGDPGATADVIASLVEKSLVTATGDTDVRYRLLETVRAYGAERLAEAGDEDRTRAAHAAYFLELAERAEPQLRSHDQVRWLDRLAAEHGNFAGAIRYAVDTGDAAVALRFVAALAWFWLMRDYDAEAAEWAGAAVEITGGSAPPGLADEYALCRFISAVGAATTSEAGTALREALGQMAPLLDAGAKHPLIAVAGPLLAFFSGDQDAGRRGLGAIAQHPDPWVRAGQRAALGHLAIHDGEIDRAAAELAAAYAGFQAVGDRWGMIVCLGGLAEVAMARGEWAEAVRMLEEGREYAAQGLAGNWAEMMLMPLAKARAGLGDLDGARSDLERGVRTAGRIGEHDDQVSGYLALSDLARRDGDLVQARRLLESALEIVESRPRWPIMGPVTARMFGKLGCLTEQEGDLAAAGRWHAKAIEAAAATEAAFLPNNPLLAEVVEGVAALAAARGEPARAAELLGLAHSLQGFRDTANLEVTRATAAAAAALGDAAYAAAYAHGQVLTRSDALALVP